ncbi:MAG TPA: rhamnulokinase family protein [Bryobacteraceae bacterium]|nr:rhamnulokinase family protein [Bryobacteraceae bacterium]
MKNFLAFDLGAESGRATLGALDDGKLTLRELHRFPNQPVRLATGLYWDTLRLFHEILQGMTVAGREKFPIEGIGIDTWGVDFALLGQDGALIDNPRHYRDTRTAGVMEKTFEVVPRREIFEQTGIQFMELNTLYQWYAMRLQHSPALKTAARLLFMPDLFNYWLTGVERNELTIASTSQFYNPRQKRYATEILDRLDLPSAVLPEIADPGTRLGTVLPVVGETTGLAGTPVYATACHDTASAVAAVPAEGGDWCYISSGTWSLMGVEIDKPVINQRALELNVTNEIGVEGRVRLLKNIAGLWVLQECRREWALGGRDHSYEELTKAAAEAKPFTAVLDPDAFLQPGYMPVKIMTYCKAAGQKVPQTAGEICRTILESLALRYRRVLESLEELLHRRLPVIHIVGGGSRNALLNQFVADATERVVVAGPQEATAAGNVLVQAIGAGLLDGLGAAREMVRRSFAVTKFEPHGSARESAGWEEAYQRFLALPAVKLNTGKSSGNVPQ